MAINGYKRNEDAIKATNRSNIYTFKTGKTVLRILPPYSERGVWFRPVNEYYFQLGDQKIFLTSPKDSGGRDPIAEHVAKLYRSGDEKLVEQAKQFKPRKRFLVNALILSDPSGTSLKDGVKVVGLPVRVKEDLVKYDTDVDEGYADITSLEAGRNITIEKTGENINTRYSVRPQPKTTNILEMAQEQGVDTSGFNLHNLDEAVKPSSFEDLQTTLNRILEYQAPTYTVEQSVSYGVADQASIPVSDTPVVERCSLNIPKVEAPVVPPPWED